MLAQILATLLHLPLCYLLVMRCNMGLKGLGLATSLTNLNLLIGTTIYCNSSLAIRKVIALPPGSFPNLFKGWKEYLKVSLPSTLIMCSEWGAFELLTVVSGLISIEAQAVQTIVTSGCAILFEIPLGY